MQYNRLLLLSIFLSCLLFSCHKPQVIRIKNLVEDSPSIKGKADYLSSPFVTAGDRVYMVGNQDGSFPEIGWHIPGEMGGIWDHPIKWMDGFQLIINSEKGHTILNQAQSFTNYPFANQHLFSLPDQNLLVERWQFVPDHMEGIIIQFLIYNEDSQNREIRLDFTSYADLRPTWLAEQKNVIDAQDQASYHKALDVWMVKDSINPWVVLCGSDKVSKSHKKEKSPYKGKGITTKLNYKVNIGSKQSECITFFITGSHHSEDAATETYQLLKQSYPHLLKEKKARYQKLAQRSFLRIPDKDIQQTFEWLKYNSDWLVRTVPEIGTGIAAGIPDYPWWFGVDSEYALKGYMTIGQHEPVYQTIKLLDSLSEVTNGNGRIIHEVSTNGVVFNKGNINETPQFASLIWDIYRWNGDLNFLKTYFPHIKKGLKWLLNDNDANKNLFPDGFGMMEIHGLNSEMIDVASYTQKAFQDAAYMAKELQQDSLAHHYQDLADQLKENINDQFWSEQFQSFADFIGTDQEALDLIEDAIVRADTLEKPWAVQELEETRQAIIEDPSSRPRPFVLHHNWVVNTPMEVGIADKKKAQLALKTAEKFVNPFGVFVTGIDRDEAMSTDDGSFQGSKVFSYTGAVMTLPTGVQAIAENNYQHPDKALDYLKRMTRSFSYALPGSMYEVSPDYGMMVQAWNIYSFAIPIISQFFGIQPYASQKKVIIHPQLPSSWDQASLEHVKIGENEISVFINQDDMNVSVKVHQSQPEWTIDLYFPRIMKMTQYKLVSSTVKVEEKNALFHVQTSELITELRLARIGLEN